MSIVSSVVEGCAVMAVGGIDISTIGYEVFDHIQMALMSCDVERGVVLVGVGVDKGVGVVEDDPIWSGMSTTNPLPFSRHYTAARTCKFIESRSWITAFSGCWEG